jgi:membrane protein
MNLEGVKQSIPGKVGQKFIEDQSPNWAVLIAWNALFAMFPIVLFAASILGLVLRLFGQANDTVYKTIFSMIPDQGTQTQILNAVTGVKSKTGILFIVGLVGLLWGGAALFGAMEQAFAVIYHTLPRKFIKQKVIGFGMVIVFTILAGAAVATSAALPALKNVPGMPAGLTMGPLGFVFQLLLGVITGFLLFSTIYYVIPNRRQEWGKVWPGALVAGIVFELITLLFPLYLTINQGINAYGKTFGLFFLLMTFFYFIGLITMLGVEVNAVIFPVPVEQPSRRGEPGRAAASAPPQSGPEGEGKAWSPKTPPQREPADEREAAPQERMPTRVPAFLIFLGSAVAGLLVGRRAAASD